MRKLSYEAPINHRNFNLKINHVKEYA